DPRRNLFRRRNASTIFVDVLLFSFQGSIARRFHSNFITLPHIVFDVNILFQCLSSRLEDAYKYTKAAIESQHFV
ncbi:hypothetical protein, partial [Planococcus chinensis]